MSDLATTPLHALHRELGARTVPFAGYAMPLQYEGIVAEHRWCRAHAALFDVSHMGQLRLRGPAAVRALERLVPADLEGLAAGRGRYTVLTNARGGVVDDLIVGRDGEGELFLVVNAARKSADLAHLRAHLPDEVTLETLFAERALLALQGPEAEAVLTELLPAVRELFFMDAARFEWEGVELRVSRTGYTGEDGFELSVPAEAAETLARRLLADPRVRPAGLGARDTLRLEAGLCLYGHELDEDTTPVEAGLAWSIGRRRREAGDFLGAGVILRQLQEGPPRRLVGLRPGGRAPLREGAPLRHGATPVGRVTSGAFGPTVGGPIALGYVRADLAAPDTLLESELRGRPLAVRVVPLPFVPHRYRRRGARP